MTTPENPQPAAPWETPNEPAPSAGPPPARYGAVRRLLMAFTSPGEVFADVARKPSFLLVLLLLGLASMGAQMMIAPRLDMESAIRARLEKVENMSEEDKDKAVEKAMAFQTGTTGRVVGAVTAFASTPIVIALVSLIFFLGLKLLGSNARYDAVLGGAAHAFWPPGIVAGLLSTVVALRQTRIDPMQARYLLKSNVGALLPDTVSPLLRSAASALDVFTIWTVVLLVIGFAIIGRVKPARSAALVVGLWVVWILVKMGFAAMGGGFA